MLINFSFEILIFVLYSKHWREVSQLSVYLNDHALDDPRLRDRSPDINCCSEVMILRCLLELKWTGVLILKIIH